MAEEKIEEDEWVLLYASSGLPDTAPDAGRRLRLNQRMPPEWVRELRSAARLSRIAAERRIMVYREGRLWGRWEREARMHPALAFTFCLRTGLQIPDYLRALPD